MSSQKKGSIDLGLEVIEAVRKPGQRMRVVDIAQVCGCTPQLIRRISNRAVEKMRAAAQERGEA